MGIIETAYIARSEPKRLKDDLADPVHEVNEVLIDEDDEVDFTFFGAGRWVLIERKKAQDLINSFLEANEGSGEPRVIAQIRRMVDYQTSGTMLCLLIEDHIYNRRGWAYAEGVRRKVAFNAIDNFLLLVQRWGIHVVRSPALNHTAARMVSVAESWIRVGDKSPLIMLPKAPDPRLRTLMTFPGVGIKGAQKMLKKHGSLGRCLEELLHGASGLGSAVDRRAVEYMIRMDTPISLRKRGE